MSPATMSAAVIDRLGAWPEVRELPVPSPGPGQLLVRIEASGICHTDVHLSAGETAKDETPPKLPIVPGHEGAGAVEELGDGVTGFEPGDRVVIGWLGGACGECRECRSGLENICRKQHNPGNSYDGTLAEYALVWPRSAARIPDGLDSAEAGPLGCAGVAAFGTTLRAGISPGDLVAVVGVGGLGHLAVQYARLAGARAIAVDPDPRRLELARELGADETIDPSGEDPAERLDELGGADAVLMFASASTAIAQGVRALRRGGRLVQAGWPTDDPVPLPVGLVIERGLLIVGSDGGTLLDLERVLRIHAEGRARLAFEQRPLAAVGEAFREVHRGSAGSPRIVLRPDLGP